MTHPTLKQYFTDPAKTGRNLAKRYNEAFARNDRGEMLKMQEQCKSLDNNVGKANFLANLTEETAKYLLEESE